MRHPLMPACYTNLETVSRQVEILKRDFNFSSFAEASRAGLVRLLPLCLSPRIWLDCESVECFSFATVRDKKYRTSKQNSSGSGSGSLSANRAEISEPNWISRMAAGSRQQAVASWKLKVAPHSLAVIRARQRVGGGGGEHSKNRAWVDSLRCQLACRLASISSLLKLPSANRPLLLKLPQASSLPRPLRTAGLLLTVASARIQMNSLNLMNNSVVALKNEGCQQHLMDLKRKAKSPESASSNLIKNPSVLETRNPKRHVAVLFMLKLLILITMLAQFWISIFISFQNRDNN